MIRFLLLTAAVLIASYILPGVEVDGFWTAVIVALVLALFNVTLKPILIILTIPVTLVTFGLFLLVINAMVVLMADALVGGFTTDGFWWALLFSIVLTLTNALLTDLSGIKPKRRQR